MALFLAAGGSIHKLNKKGSPRQSENIGKSMMDNREAFSKNALNKQTMENLTEEEVQKNFIQSKGKEEAHYYYSMIHDFKNLSKMLKGSDSIYRSLLEYYFQKNEKFGTSGTTKVTGSLFGVLDKIIEQNFDKNGIPYEDNSPHQIDLAEKCQQRKIRFQGFVSFKNGTSKNQNHLKFFLKKCDGTQERKEIAEATSQKRITSDGQRSAGVVNEKTLPWASSLTDRSQDHKSSKIDFQIKFNLNSISSISGMSEVLLGTQFPLFYSDSSIDGGKAIRCLLKPLKSGLIESLNCQNFGMDLESAAYIWFERFYFFNPLETPAKKEIELQVKSQIKRNLENGKELVLSAGVTRFNSHQIEMEVLNQTPKESLISNQVIAVEARPVTSPHLSNQNNLENRSDRLQTESGIQNENGNTPKSETSSLSKGHQSRQMEVPEVEGGQSPPSTDLNENSNDQQLENDLQKSENAEGIKAEKAPSIRALI